MSATAQVSIAFQGNKRPDEYVDLATAVEAAGFDGISVFADLGFQPPWQPLALMAHHTRRLRLGPACVNPFTTHPIEIAGHAATLDLVAGGRTYLGITKGTWLDQVGVRQATASEALRDTAAIVRNVLSGSTEGYAGDVFRLQPGFGLRFERARDVVPLLIGAWGPRAVAVAGEIADELKVGGTANPDLVPVMHGRLATGAARVGRDPTEIAMVFGAVTVVDDDGNTARQLARSEVAMYLAVLAELDPTINIEPELLTRVRQLVQHNEHDAAGRLISPDLLGRFAFAGTPTEVAEHAARLFDAGLDRIEFGTPHGVTSQRGVKLLGTKVLPALQGDLRTS